MWIKKKTKNILLKNDIKFNCKLINALSKWWCSIINKTYFIIINRINQFKETLIFKILFHYKNKSRY